MLDKKYNALEKEAKWLNYWNENKIYKFIPDGRKVFSIDTPPPTVNGKIHIGHIFLRDIFSLLELQYKKME